MVQQSTFLVYFLAILIKFIFYESTCLASSSNGFTVDLIHREYSPESPFYDSSLTPSQRLMNSLQRSLDLINHDFNISSKLPVTDLTSSRAQYLMKYAIGTPPVLSYGIFDTGSNTIWTQCQPCVSCFNQKLPIFDPKASSTYSRVDCGSFTCRTFGNTNCSADGLDCLYTQKYSGGSVTSGYLSIDDITLPTSDGKHETFQFVNFGCGVNNVGTFSREETGIIGFGGGQSSFVRQLYYAFGGKFSYCFVSHFLTSGVRTSKMNFGSNAVVSGRGTVSTPLARFRSGGYFLTLEGVSVGGHRIEFYDDDDSKAAIDRGNIILDTGVVLTQLPLEFYLKIKFTVKSLILLKQVPHPQFDLCFLSRHNVFLFPLVVFHFKGANVELKSENVFVRIDDTIFCLAILPSKRTGLSFFGNIAQMDFLVGFDLKSRMVSFKATSCGS